MTEKIAMRLLYEDKPSEAIPAALQSLRCAEILYGRDSVHLVPPFLILAEACVGLSMYLCTIYSHLCYEHDIRPSVCLQRW